MLVHVHNRSVALQDGFACLHSENFLGCTPLSKRFRACHLFRQRSERLACMAPLLTQLCQRLTALNAASQTAYRLSRGIQCPRLGVPS